MQPAPILLLGAMVFGETVRSAQIAGLCLSVIGALTIILGGNLSALTRLAFNAGDLVICAAVVVWSFYSVLLRKRPAVHPLSFLAATFVVGIVIIAPVYAAEIASGRLIESRAESWLAISYVCRFPSLIAYLFFNRGVELLGSAATGLHLNIMPVIGALLAGAILSEPIRWFHFLGMGLIFAGILSAARRSGKPVSRAIRLTRDSAPRTERRARSHRRRGAQTAARDDGGLR